MERARALALVATLADGIDPFTGEAFAADSPYQHPDVVRALFLAHQALVHPAAERRQRGGGSNAGKPWTATEDERLCTAFDGGDPIKAIADLHGRSRLAIEARLAKLGRLPEPDGLRSLAVPPGRPVRAEDPGALRYAA
ncbi:MAG: hypothetical protein KIT73_07225 [Burkholderiales bacterium]|nr:hypothetical protein [Burkholderiales bacterium]